ncbi:hydrolase Nlp/P60 [Algibacter marinivivus]|uniref:Hydrolase Nlp/P60 n=1 Tax=Algibacter marinivivus TaxID=2100723 RepID=A0A2U2X4C6_9FLAO|nr:C40 family peptidase [Algibacter marinivivus]PWH82622.1 hydrolase Nlp/P60 [Algibacter marinivivus]
MQYGICNLSIVPLRYEPADTSELVSQVIYGDFFKILEKRKKWSKIRLAFDKYEGWIDNKQYFEISENQYKSLAKEDPILSTDLVEFIEDENNQIFPISIGSCLNGLSLLNHKYEGNSINEKIEKSNIIQTAFTFLNAPYLWGGKTPFGIDCSGFTQMVYKLNGYKLLRDASQQATQGEALSFIEESEPGDLAFFDNSEGAIIHVGIIMKDNYIIHAHGKVRIDRLDHSGIYNVDKNEHTHKLRVIKKII